MTIYRALAPEELGRIRDRDRSERVTHGYVQHGSEIERREVEWDIPTFDRYGDGPWSVARKAAEWKAIAEQSEAFGALDSERLLGVCVLRHRLRADMVDMAELAVLHVDRAHRGQGIGRRLAIMGIAAAQASGARAIYVSASDAERAVRFHLGLGFCPTATADPTRLAQEPTDIRMVLRFGLDGAACPCKGNLKVR